MTHPLQSVDPLAALLAPASAGAGFAAEHRTAQVVFWNDVTGEHAVTLDGVLLTDLPVLGSVDVTSVIAGQFVALLGTRDSKGVVTYGIVGTFAKPPVTPATTDPRRGRGIIAGTFGGSQSNSSAISTGTAIQSDGVGVFPNGRAFKIVHVFAYLGSVAGNQPTLFLRAGPQAPTSGTVRQVALPPVTATGQNHTAEALFVNTSGSDQTGPAAAVIQSGSGTTTETASSAAPRYVYCEDIGQAADFSTALPSL